MQGTPRAPTVTVAAAAAAQLSAQRCRSPCPQFDYYGAATPLRTVASISTPESTLLVIQVRAQARQAALAEA